MTKIEKLYTVLNGMGNVVFAHLDIESAAIEILRYDGSEYIVEKIDGMYKLFTKRLNDEDFDRKYPTEVSTKADKDDAITEMLENIVDRAATYKGWDAEAILDDEYERDLKEQIEAADEQDRPAIEARLAEWKRQ